MVQYILFIMTKGELDLYDFKTIDCNSDAGSAEVDFLWLPYTWKRPK